MAIPKKKQGDGEPQYLWQFIIIPLSMIAIASFVMSIVALTKKDKDTTYVIPNPPDTSAIIPFYNTTFSTQIHGTTNSANATIMMEVKGNTVTIQFPYYFGDCTGANVDHVSTDPIPLEYAIVNASEPTQVLIAPQTFTPIESASTQKLGRVWLDVDRIIYIYFGFPVTSNFDSDTYIYPFTLVYFRETTYPETAP